MVVMSSQGAPRPTLPSLPRLLILAAVSGSRRPVATFVGLPVTLFLAIGGCLVPLFNFPFILAALAPTVGALPMIAHAVAKDERLPWWAPFLGFTRYERFLGLFWVPYLVAAGAAIPFLIGLWVDRHLSSEAMRPFVLGLPGSLSVLILAAALHRYILAPFAAAAVDRGEPFSAVLERALALIHGRRWAVLWRFTALGGLLVLAFLIDPLAAGILFPLMALAGAHLYLAAESLLSGEPPTIE